jgi:hypothetical protein
MDDRKKVMEAVFDAKKTGRASMTVEEWGWRATLVRVMSEADQGGKFHRALIDLGLFHKDERICYGNFADLMGVSPATVQRWIETNKVPRYALAYIELAAVLKAAQSKFADTPQEGKPLGSSPRSDAQGDALLPKVSRPPHTQLSPERETELAEAFEQCRPSPSPRAFAA